MKHPLLSAALLVVLTGCSPMLTDSGRNVREHTHQVVPAAALRTLRVENVAGEIVIVGSKGSVATIDVTKLAGHQDAINNTQVIVDRMPDEIDLHTKYLKTGWFGSRGATVDYTIAVPPHTGLHVANVSGPVTLRGVTANVEIQEVSGAIDASLGRVAENRDVRINTVSGGTRIAIARNSDATIDVKSVSGTIRGFFSMTSNKGFVGQAVHSRVGGGSATIDVNAVSGSVDIVPQ